MKVGQKISKAEVKKLAPDYITAFDYSHPDTSLAFFRMWDKFNVLKRGQLVITKARKGSGYIVAKVESVKYDNYTEPEEPNLRVSDGQFSWRCNGNHYAYPIEKTA